MWLQSKDVLQRDTFYSSEWDCSAWQTFRQSRLLGVGLTMPLLGDLERETLFVRRRCCLTVGRHRCQSRLWQGIKNIAITNENKHCQIMLCLNEFEMSGLISI